VESLATSILDRPEGEIGYLERDERDVESDARIKAEILDESNSIGLSTLLEACSRLEHLCVSFCCRSSGWFEEAHDATRQKQVHNLLQKDFPSLQSICLGGMNIQLTDLTKFLTKHQVTLRSIKLNVVMISNGLLSNMLSLIASDQFNLDAIYFVDIYGDDIKDRAYLHREPYDRSTYISGPFHCCNIIHRWWPDTRKVITYSNATFGRRETGELINWRRYCDEQFGLISLHHWLS
jgi:hypothetical protein